MLDKYFDFVKREKEIYQQWEKTGIFKYEPQPTGTNSQTGQDNSPVFNITMPPPNANGELHIGHCYGYTIMDILGRYHRLKGDQVLLLPGKDHAGIQTQVVYEKKLREEGIAVENLSRAEFYKKCYDFCLDRSGYMRDQEKLIGVSADFDREIFTLDPRVSEVVYETFLKLWEDGLVYRGSRLVHWSVYSQTSISDVEVEYKEEKGHLWHIKYPLLEQVELPARQRIFLNQLGLELLPNTGNHQVILLDTKMTCPSPTNVEINQLKAGQVLVKITNKDGIDIERDYIIFGLRKMKFADLTDQDQEKYNDLLRAKMQEMGEFLLIDLVPDLDQRDGLVVATTRPETMLGDSAVAVHPADPRYTHLLGKKLIVPIIGRKITIIADDRIDIAFGTGAVKITPAHDFLDYEIGKTHQLEEIQVIDRYGKMTEAAGQAYQGMKTLDARAQLIKDLDASGALLLTEEITHKVPIAERGKDIIEPLISKQWFLAVDKPGNSLKQRTLALLNSGQLNVYPARLKNQITQWLENLHDWNISRQIMWGHQMPVWYKNKDQENEQIQVGDRPAGEGWEQETDTFDTWFSSGQWPFSTLAASGLLDLENPAESQHFPTHTMVMGRDILLFWACRMLLFGTYRLNNLPWKNIYFTGLVRDAKGQKMSKSKGNGVEPTAILSKYGADALRVGLIAGSTPGQDIKFDEKKIESYAKFVNKIWNAAKLVEMKLEGNYNLRLADLPPLRLESSQWILGELADYKSRYEGALNKYELSKAFECIYEFSWNIFCSWYLEIAKVQLDLVKNFRENAQGENIEVTSDTGLEIQTVMSHVFREMLQMLHSFMPFFTEEIYQNFQSFGYDQMLAQSKLNFADHQNLNADQDTQANTELRKLRFIITAARECRAVLGKGFNDQLHVYYQGELSEQSASVIAKIANLQFLSNQPDLALIKPDRFGNLQIEATTAEKQSFKENIEKTLIKKSAELITLEKILTPGFKLKADPDLVKEREDQQTAVSKEVETLQKELAYN